MDPKDSDIMRLCKNINRRDDFNKDEKWVVFLKKVILTIRKMISY